MENDKRNWHDHRMSGEKAFEMMFGGKDETYPEEMKQEFVGIYDRAKEAMKSLYEERHSFMDKWKDRIGDGGRFPGGVRPGVFGIFGMFGHMCAPGFCGGHGLRECGPRHGGQQGFFGW